MLLQLMSGIYLLAILLCDLLQEATGSDSLPVLFNAEPFQFGASTKIAVTKFCGANDGKKKA